MDFFGKVGETLTSVGKEATNKAKEVAGIANLKSQIYACDEVMKKNYIEIGKLYYEKYRENPEEMFAKACREIENAAKEKSELEEKVNEIKK